MQLSVPVFHSSYPSFRRFARTACPKCSCRTVSCVLFSGLTWNTSWNDHNISALERLLDTLSILGEETFNLRNGRDVAQIGSDTWGVDHIIKGEMVDERTGLEEEREWLADTARGTCNDCGRVLLVVPCI